MFLFPKTFASNSEINSSNMVLKDKHGNSVTIPLRSTVTWDQNNCIINSKDEYQKMDLSKEDLKSIYNQFNSLLHGENLTPLEREKVDVFSLESFFKEQQLRLEQLKENIMTDATESEKEIICSKLPTIEQLLSTKDYIVRIEQDVIPLMRNYTADDGDELTQDYSVYHNLPSILRQDDVELDLFNAKKFAIEFRAFRLHMNMSQKDVATSIDLLLQIKFSQTTICRFEAGSLNFSNMRYLIPYFRRWFKKVYSAGLDTVKKDIKRNQKQNDSSDESHESVVPETAVNKVGDLTDTVKISSNDVDVDDNDNRLTRRNRDKRTVFTIEQKHQLEILFQRVKLTQVTANVYEKFGRELDLDPKKIKTWMVKRRREMRRELQIQQRKSRK